MVQQLDPQRDVQHPRNPFSVEERYSAVPAPDLNYHKHQQPPMTIEKALRQHAKLDGSHYFVAYLGHDGQVRTLVSPSQQHVKVTAFFDSDKFSRSMHRIEAASTLAAGQDAGLDNSMSQFSRWGMDRRYTRDADAFDDDRHYKTRKRQRASGARRQVDYDDDTLHIPTVASTRAIELTDEDELWNFYEQRFKNCQQTACKLIAKAWIKAVEPKKQSTHPYTGSDEKAPDWWPQPWGPGKDDRVRHKEPDHLYKRERLHLLNHILRMIVKPNDQQPPNVRKLNLDVHKLEEVTNEALSAFFTDKDNLSNAQKRPYLREIFKVAYQEERHRAGKLGTSRVFVKSDDRLDGYMSDRDEASLYKSEGDKDDTPISSRVSPSRNGMPFHGAGHSPSNLQGGSFMSVGDMGTREPYQQPMLTTDGATDPHHYVEDTVLPPQPGLHTPSGYPEMYSNPHDASRRSSAMVPTPTDYHSPAAPAVYSWTNTSNGPSHSYAPHQPAAPSNFVNPSGVAVAPNQDFMAYNHMARSHNAPISAALYRPDGFGSSTMGHAGGYADYVQGDGRILHGAPIKMETLARNSIS